MKNDHEDFCGISKELLSYLAFHFPDKCASLNDNKKEIYFKAGQHSVVEHLKFKRKELLEKEGF